MQYFPLGKSSLRVTRIGFGCMSLRGDEKKNIELIHRAIDLGINFFDTADIYNDGGNERLVGKAVRGKRDKLVLATKAGNVRRADEGLDWNPSARHILAAAEASLKRLGVDCIDLYQLHGGTIQDNIDETIGAFERLQEQGKIRYYGISSIRPNVIREYIRRSSIVSVMMQYSLIDRRPEEACLDLLHQHNIGVLARGGLAQGLLAGKPAVPYLYNTAEQVQQAAEAVAALSGPTSGRTAASSESVHNSALPDKVPSEAATPALSNSNPDQTAASSDSGHNPAQTVFASPAAYRSAAQTALQYVLSHPAVTCAVTGISNIEQLAGLVATDNVPQLNSAELEQLRRKVLPGTYKDHR